MANEATIRVSLQIRKVSGSLVLLDYQSRPTSFQATVTGTKGPTPGALTIPAGGEAVSFGELSTPGLCILKNLSATVTVEYGIRDPGIDVFYPLGEILPGEIYLLRLSRNLLEEYQGTGTGTTSPGNQFFMKGMGGDVNVSVEAFEQ